MAILVFFMLLFVALGLIWLIGAGLLAGALFSRIPRALDSVLDYKGKHCACRLPFHEHW